MKKITIQTGSLSTLSWLENRIVDWKNAGLTFDMEGNKENLAQYRLAYRFDAAINSPCGNYAFVYERYGTKGLLLKNGIQLREINRTYYQANEYEYPATFARLEDGRTILIHCPYEYCRLDFEDAETGEILTNRNSGKSEDIFRSRLEVSPDGRFLLEKSWVWHPWDIVKIHDIEACLANPDLLEQGKEPKGNTSEICSASFINSRVALLASTTEEPFDDENSSSVPPGTLSVWDFVENKILHHVKVDVPFGNVFAVNEIYCWDLYEYPKIIDLRTGEVTQAFVEMRTGKRRSAIRNQKETEVLWAFNSFSKTIAIYGEENVVMLIPEL